MGIDFNIPEDGHYISHIFTAPGSKCFYFLFVVKKT